MLVLLAVSIAPLAATVGAAAGTATPRPPEDGRSWPRRLVVGGDFSGLVAGGASLYSLQGADRPAHPRAVRIDPQDGHVVAVSPVLPAATSIAFAGDAVFVAAAASVSENLEHLGPPLLEVLDRSSLRRIAVLRLPGRVVAMAAAPGPLLWLALASDLVEIDPTRARIVRVVPAGGSLTGVTIDAAGARLYDVDVPSGRRVSAARLEERDAGDGRLLAVVSVPDWPSYFTLAASGTSVFAATGDPGAPGVLFRFETTPLRLVSASFTEGGSGRTETGGATGPALPSFGQFPLVDLSPGAVFVSSDDQLACFSAATGRLEAITGQRREPIVTGPIVETAHRTYAVANFEQPSGTGIVRLSPPSSCG